MMGKRKTLDFEQLEQLILARFKTRLRNQGHLLAEVAVVVMKDLVRDALRDYRTKIRDLLLNRQDWYLGYFTFLKKKYHWNSAQRMDYRHFFSNYLDKTLDYVDFYQCGVCTFVAEQQEGLRGHSDVLRNQTCAGELVEYKKVYLNFWETDQPFSPSKIKPGWWALNREIRQS